MCERSGESDNVLQLIHAECQRQLEKWGQQEHQDGEWLLILQEEIGEACERALNRDRIGEGAELVQAAAVIVSWLVSWSRKEAPHV